ncbi:MAG TPA: NADP-dependent malic enzyme [Geminicoccus sp.]|uniref:NADP-dependent malic enzyme n=1 Tax=Geminicoccus sp. TaxID=2024832 RepID=UPI002E37D6DE|nr:NADP-dependent malic enzyme [Geminicoccus sp.]HEX2524910.1 NADP-dependent malic enzyme [Geminicoccus sp.]
MTQLRDDALEYHARPVAGKLEVRATKPLSTQRDLSLAYSPGVAAACEEIAADPQAAALYTSRGNLVAVVTNGTAVLGLGAIGALASKPVMEGKAVLFKKFAGIDAFDIELDELDPDKLCDIVAALEPTFGAINLEDIKAPECFHIEKTLRERMKIPVFHDDQHGTAIIVSAAIVNALHLVGKRIEDVRLVASGAGAAALACLDLLLAIGLKRENVTVTDILGVVYEGRTELMDPWKAKWARPTEARVLADAIPGADIFLGLSAANVLKLEMLASMAHRPIVLALANPNPEIPYELAKSARPDAIVATGRSDNPNQVNNVLCFPYIFRGALDVGATTINTEMAIACVHALAELARATTPEMVHLAYHTEYLAFGPEYVIPKPFDPRLVVDLPVAVAKAAMETGVATRPIEDLAAYRASLSQKVYKSGLIMRPQIARAKSSPQRLVFTHGEEERILRAVQVVVEEQIARPILIGRPDVIQNRIERYGLRLTLESDVDLVNPNSDPRYNDYVAFYRDQMGRRGVTPQLAREVVRTSPTVIAAIMVARGEADAMIAGPVGRFIDHLKDVQDVIGMRPDTREASTVHGLLLDRGLLFLADTYVSVEQTAETIVETTLAASRAIDRFGIKPKVALVSHSNFGSRESKEVRMMREALAIIRERSPGLEIDGEMHADTALLPALREKILPDSNLAGEANLLIMPGLDAAHIAYSLVRAVTNCVSIGPIVLGPRLPAHIVTPSVTARGITNMAAIACAEAISLRLGESG